MARLSADLFFSQIFMEYLQTPESEAAGVPGDGELQMLVLDSGQLAKLPGLVITAAEKEGTAQIKRHLDVVFALLFMNRPMGEDAPKDAASLERTTTAERASQMVDAIESRLMDRAALSAFLAALAPERREGWKIMKWRRIARPHLKRDDKPVPRMTYMMAFELQVIWAN